MIVAYTALHYGSMYLGWAIRSIIDSVDKYVVLYSEQGSHGARANMYLPPSEHKQQLQWVAYQAAGTKLEWVSGDWQREGDQRDEILKLYPQAEMVIVLDYDEIWSEGLVDAAIAQAREQTAYSYRMPMIHFWRSFRRAILHDPAYPTRIICPAQLGEAYLHFPEQQVINHMGYAIPTWLLDYKMHIHGHRAQWRTDINWREDKWLANAQEDCHPVGSEYWNAEAVSPYVYLPQWMSEHPFALQEVIECEPVGVEL